jgi:hypothetical protein
MIVPTDEGKVVAATERRVWAVEFQYLKKN